MLYAALVGFVAEPGKILEGRYILRAHLGHGGMGTVWRAEHTKLKTPVAVKLIAPSMVQSREALARFDREARVAASLDGPNIVRVIDFGIQEDTPFIAMELLEGETLGARLARGALSPEVTLRVVSQIARGVARAHQARVVHCDLKPENVFLAHVDGEEVAKILDFGVAKAPLLDPLTQTGAVLGTLQYMSPEQLEGRKNVGERSDLYSLAVIVFECVCGRPAFRGDSIAELVRRICGAPLPVPSSIARVPAGFDAWFARAAHRDPTARFSSAREMSDALVAVFDRASSRSVAAVSVTAPAEIPATIAAARTGGTQAAGYRVTCDERARILYVELWGMHDVPLAREAKNVLIEASKTMKPGGPWVALGGGAHPPQSPEVQALESESMAAGMALGMARIAFVQPSALAKMMVRRLTAEIKMPNARFFNDEAEAREWLAEALVPARRGGNERAGFAIRANKQGRLLLLELWGLWDATVARAFRTEALAAYAEMGHGPWFVLSQSRRYMPQKDEIQAIHEECTTVALSQGLARVAVLVDSALSHVQIRRLLEEAGSPPHLRFFTDEEDALAWLAEPQARNGRG